MKFPTNSGPRVLENRVQGTTKAKGKDRILLEMRVSVSIAHGLIGTSMEKIEKT